MLTVLKIDFESENGETWTSQEQKNYWKFIHKSYFRFNMLDWLKQADNTKSSN